MPVIRVTKEFSFEMAHALWNYDGACSNIHGHSYKLFVTVTGEPSMDKGDPKNGMVVDFGDLKKWVKTAVVSEFDHSLVISADADGTAIKDNQMFNNLIVTDFQPTCENLLVYMAAKIKKQLPGTLRLYSLKLRETGTSYAEWFADDNP